MASRTRARINNLNDRAREVGAVGVLTLDDIDALKAFYDFTCLKCGAKPAISPDHVKPLATGGANTVDNLQLLCDNCNKGKGDEEIDYRRGKVLTADLVPLYSKSTNNPTKTNYKKHNWEELQFEYVTTDLSLRDLADKHDMDASLVLKRAASERWLKEREKFAINLLSEVKIEAQKAEVSSRVMILEAARIALEEWKANDEPTKLDDLSKILELAARIEGYEMNKTSVTVKDWRDVGREAGADPDELEQYFATLEGGNVQSVESEQGAGWTD